METENLMNGFSYNIVQDVCTNQWKQNGQDFDSILSNRRLDHLFIMNMNNSNYHDYLLIVDNKEFLSFYFNWFYGLILFLDVL